MKEITFEQAKRGRLNKTILGVYIALESILPLVLVPILGLTILTDESDPMRIAVIAPYILAACIITPLTGIVTASSFTYDNNKALQRISLLFLSIILLSVNFSNITASILNFSFMEMAAMGFTTGFILIFGPWTLFAKYRKRYIFISYAASFVFGGIFMAWAGLLCYFSLRTYLAGSSMPYLLIMPWAFSIIPLIAMRYQNYKKYFAKN